LSDQRTFLAQAELQVAFAAGGLEVRQELWSLALVLSFAHDPFVAAGKYFDREGRENDPSAQELLRKVAVG
jgi:hypothetical protein